MGEFSAKIPLSSIVGGRRVVLDRPGGEEVIDAVLKAGAQGTLVLSDRAGIASGAGRGVVSKPFTRIKDVSTNNCQVAVLHGSSSALLSKRYKFQGFRFILVPFGLSLLGAGVGLLRYARRGDMTIAGRTTIPTGGGDKRYLVLAIKDRVREVRRQYAPAGLTPLEIVRSVSDLDLVLLRGAADISAGRHAGDIDILVSAKDVETLKQRFNSEIGTYPVDVYTDDGSAGHTQGSAPYYAPNVAKRIISSAIMADGIKVPSPEWQFLSYCYHVLFHDKLLPAADGSPLSRSSFVSPGGFDELTRLAKIAGRLTPQSVDKLEEILRGAAAMPSLDLIGFYSNSSPFLKRRYFDADATPPGLVTFFLRDFGRGLEDVAPLHAELARRFTILAEGPVSDAMRAEVRRGVRGGNWTDAQSEGGQAEAIYWFVCWDNAPKAPSLRTRRKHPRVDNENVRIKDTIRSSLGDGGRKVRGILHSSDNTSEALDHLRCLGLLEDAALIAFLKSKHIHIADRGTAAG